MWGGMTKWLRASNRKTWQRPRTQPVKTFPPQAVRHTQPSKSQACSALDERVVMLDSMGRAGSRYYDLDWVRRERKDARDQQYRLRC